MSQKYYTQNGEYIKNPKGYAKTGAPMYESQSINDINDINKETFIYYHSSSSSTCLFNPKKLLHISSMRSVNFSQNKS